MAAQTLLQLRRGTAAQWTTANSILSVGEPGYESDTGNFKLGDGVTDWNTLPYVGADKALAGHTHTAAQITDSTVTGRAVLTAASAAAARSAIGAGTSDLVLGSTGTTAKAGNWFPSFSEVTGTLGTNQLPPLAINDTFVVASQAAMLALTAQRGDIAIRTDTSDTFVLASDSPATLADWKEIVANGQVISVAGKTGAVSLVKADVGLSNVDNTSDAAKPVSTATQSALNAKENTIAAGTTAQYYRGDKTWVTHDKASVGLANVDNTADTAKPVSTATQTALNAKENTIAAGTIGQYYRGDKTWATNDKASVGLGNVDNTSDVNKPVSTATNTALGLKANTASPTFTGTVTLPSTTNGLSKSNVGLGNVDNTSDAAKPVSTATQTALNGKANTAHTHTSAEISNIDGGTP